MRPYDVCRRGVWLYALRSGVGESVFLGHPFSARVSPREVSRQKEVVVVRILMVPSWLLLSHNQLSPANTLPVCQEALKLWQTGAYDLLLLSGGLFLPAHIQSRPSSELMQDWFVEQGVDPRQIVLETRSLDTYDNIRYSLEELASVRIGEFAITVCTHRIHGRRIKHTFRRAHGVDITVHPVPLPLRMMERCQQWMYVLYHWLDPFGNGWLARRTRAKRYAQIWKKPSSV